MKFIDSGSNVFCAFYLLSVVFTIIVSLHFYSLISKCMN